MDLHFKPEVELPNTTAQKISLYNLRCIQLHEIFIKSQTHQMPLQKCLPRTDYKHYCRCREQMPSGNACPNIYQMEKHQTMELISFYTSRDYFINMSQIQTRSSRLLSYLKHGNTQYSWKHMTKLVTRELLIHTAS